MRAIFNPSAEKDIADVVDYLIENYPHMVLGFYAAIETTSQELARSPGIGRPRDFGIPRFAGMRSRYVTGFRDYLIFYRPIPEGVEILRVIHGKRDLDSIFKQP